MILPLIIAVTLHEVAHGYAALKMGDHTARLAGRLTLNPIKHLDLFGSLLLPLILTRYRDHRLSSAMPNRCRLIITISVSTAKARYGCHQRVCWRM